VSESGGDVAEYTLAILVFQLVEFLLFSPATLSYSSCTQWTIMNSFENDALSRIVAVHEGALGVSFVSNPWYCRHMSILYVKAHSKVIVNKGKNDGTVCLTRSLRSITKI
jgi:hypothetical protein